MNNCTEGHCTEGHCTEEDCTEEDCAEEHCTEEIDSLVIRIAFMQIQNMACEEDLREGILHLANGDQRIVDHIMSRVEKEVKLYTEHDLTQS